METLKVTTLSLLIAFVWLTSEVAAYPEEIDRADVNDIPLNCRRSSIDHSEFQELGGNLLGLSDTTMRRVAPPNITHRHLHQNTTDDACGFNLDLNETHSLEVAH